MPKTKPATDPFSVDSGTDPFSNLQVAPTDEVSLNPVGRQARPLNENAVKLVEASYNNGKPQPMQTTVGSNAQAMAIIRELRRVCDKRDPKLTLQSSISTDEIPGSVVLRFKARERIYRTRSTD